MDDDSQNQMKREDEEREQEKKEQYVMAIVKPKKRAGSLKKWLLTIGTACFCGGFGIGTALAVLSPMAAKTEKMADASSFESKNVAKITYEDHADMDGVVVDIAKNIGPCVVSVYNNKKVSSSDLYYYFSDNKGEILTGLGSGILFKEDAAYYYIMTNSHVVEGADSLAVNFLGNIKAACQLVGKDSENDIAVVKVKKILVNDEEKLKIGIAPLGNSDLLEAGQLAVAIGTPATDALNNTVTRGIISAKERSINISGVNMTVIQTDAAINPGNSGGALVGPTGEVIGMNVAKSINTEGIGFAIPINIVKPIVADIMVNGSVVRPAMGIIGVAITQSTAQKYDLPIGVFIDSVVTGGSADLAGIKAGDILIQFDGKMVTGMNQLKAMIAQKRVGDTVKVKVIREEQHKVFTLELKERPE